MDLTSSETAWAILIVVAVALVFAASWFSLRTLRVFTCVMAIVLAITITRFGASHPEYRHANLVDSFLSGVDQVAIAVLHPFWPGRVPALGVAGRWIIAVALFLGYRQLEALGLRRQTPELDLSAIDRGQPAGHNNDHHAGWLSYRHDDRRTAGERHAQLVEELRFRLSTMEVRSPSILPGGARTNALAAIAETSGVSGAGMVSAVFRLAGMFWPGPRLIRVRSWVESAAGTRITVLLENVKTGLPIATRTVAGDSFNETASMVTGYIARQIFAMDRTVPTWCYGTSDGRDLGAMQLARLARFYAACPREVHESRKLQIDILTDETGAVRTSGIVRYELAQLLALDDQHLESLRLHALNRELHPRLYRGRYRLAMSLEMIANPEHYFLADEAAARKLAEILKIISRYEHIDSALQQTAKNLGDSADRDVALPSNGKTRCMRVPQELALKLLEIAAQDLREVRTQLKLGHVLWDAFFRRDERAVWLPHRKRQHRKSFQDGVCAAELLVALRCRLRESADANPGWFRHARVRWYLRRALRITWCIAGEPSFIYSALTGPQRKWWEPEASKSALDRLSRAWVRWPPWGRSSASWQAAYNTACLYAALADAVWRRGGPDEILRELERRVIVGLRSVVDNPRSELERAWDWIFGDPDFRVMRDDRKKFTAFGEFLDELERQEYPASLAGKCHVPHANPGIVARRLANTEPPIFSPVRNPVPTGDGEHAYVLILPRLQNCCPVVAGLIGNPLKCRTVISTRVRNQEASRHQWESLMAFPTRSQSVRSCDAFAFMSDMNPSLPSLPRHHELAPAARTAATRYLPSARHPGCWNGQPTPR
jgi:hypothetical protein